MPSVQKATIRSLLDDFNYRGNNRLTSTESVTEFWKRNRNSQPELYALAEIIFSIFSTEVSTERHFSALGFVLNKFRNSLSDKSLQEIMFMKLNEEIFWKV